jgi:dGTP triphosphohydrolase
MANINTVAIVIQGFDKSSRAFTDAKTGLIQLEKVAKTAALTLAAMGAAGIGTAATKLVSFTREAIESADATGKLAQKAGIAVEDFSRLSYATNLSEVETGTFQTAIKKLSDEMVTAGRGSASVVAEILKVSDKFAGMSDGAAKTTLAVKTFGKAGQEMIPFLNQGSEAIRRQMEEAERFGLVVGKDFAHNADEFNDNLSKMKLAFKGVFLQVADQTLPKLVEMSERIVKMTRDGGALQDTVLGLSGSFHTMTDAIEGMKSLGPETLRNMELGIKAMIPAALVFDAVWQKMIERGKEAKDLADWKKKWDEASGNTETTNKASFVVDDADAKRAAAMLERLQVAQLDGYARLRAEEGLRFSEQLRNIGALQVETTTANELVRLAQEEHWNRLNEMKESGELIRADMDVAFRQGDIERFKGMLFTFEQSEAASLEARQQVMKAYQERAELMRDDSFTREVKRLKQLENLRTGGMDEGIRALQNLASAAETFGKKQNAAQKVFATSAVIMSTAQAVMKIWEQYGWPWGAIFSVSAVAAGAAQLSNISKAHAGLDYVPEESTFLLQRGERVIQPEANRDLTDFLDGGRVSGGSRGGQMIHNHVYIDGREILNYLSEASRDGRLIIDAKSVV